MRSKLTSGEEWDIDLYQNEGWHWTIKGGNFTIYESQTAPGEFICLIRSTGQAGGYMMDTWPAFTPSIRYMTPDNAIQSRLDTIGAYYQQRMLEYSKIVGSVKLPE